MPARLEVRPYGDCGLLAEVLGEDYETRWSTTHALAAAVRGAHPSWLVDLVATYDHLFVTFDPGRGAHDGVEHLLNRLVDELEDDAVAGFESGGRTYGVPVLFGGEAGPDLDAVAAELGLSADTVVERVTGVPWRVRFVGSPVGSMFTDTESWQHTVPRMRQPRTAVPPGSVALSGSQSCIYSVKSPGGWRLVGRTPFRVVDPPREREDFVVVRPGDRLQYVPIDPDRFAELAAREDRLDADW
jgi:KipI family sensor histidine kinase inhibitor